MVSIIIPYYNSELYIRKCIDSVLCQSYSHIEVVLIDDASTDSSSSLVDEVISSYSGPISFIHLHQEHNQGQSAARNLGIVSSTGEYLFFLDSDDYISENCIELLLKQVQDDPKLEMVMGDLQQVNETYNWPSFFIPNPISADIIKYACSYQIYTMPWNKLINKHFLISNSLFFIEGLFHEDDLWSFEVACKLKHLGSIPQKTYYYVIHENSTQTKKSFEFHFVNNSLVRIKMIEYVFANGLSSNLDIFHFIYDDIYYFVFDALSHKRKDLVSFFLEKLRHVPFWRLNFLMANSKSVRNVVFSLFRYLPPCTEVGYFVLIKYIAQFMSKMKRG